MRRGGETAKVGRTVVQGEGTEEGNNFSSILESDYSSQRSRIAQIARNGKEFGPHAAASVHPSLSDEECCGGSVVDDEKRDCTLYHNCSKMCVTKYISV